jgi:zinc finger HIT domain-containing protein 3
VGSCSLACTQAHKPSCTPKVETASPLQPPTSDDGVTDKAKEENPPLMQLTREDDYNPPRFEDLAASSELRILFETHPTLPQRLREIYRNTLEEEWSSSLVDQEPGPERRGRASHRGKGGHGTQNRGPWNADKGFRRGLGRVRKWRESCEKEMSTGSDAEGFMKFFALVNGRRDSSNSKDS